MAIGEEMQQAFQQQQHEFQVLTARMAAMETQLQFQTARVHQAEQERSRLIENRGSTGVDRGSAMVDTKEIGQLCNLKGTSEQDFGEWTHKVRTFILVLIWASRQQKDCCQDLRSFAEESHDIVEQAGEDVIENIDDFVGKLYA